MFLESIIIALIVSLFIKNKNYKNLIYFKFHNLNLIFIGIIILFAINFITSSSFGNISYFFTNYYYIFHILALFLLCISLFSNRDNLGFLIMGIGVLLNIIPIIFNKKMPVSFDALMKTDNKRVIDIIVNNNSLSHGIFESPKFYFLSDLIPVNRLIGQSVVISIGDIFISIGLIIALINIIKIGSE